MDLPHNQSFYIEHINQFISTMPEFPYSCPICGAPINADGEGEPWISNAILLSDYTPDREGVYPGCETTCDEDIYLTKATVAEDMGKEWFHLNGHTLIQACYWPWSQAGNPCFIPVHQSCWDIAKRVVTLRSESEAHAGSVTSMKALYESLLVRRRRNKSTNYQFWEAHNYFIHDYPHSYEWFELVDEGLVFSDPISIPDPTDFILSLLKPLPPANENTSSPAHTSLKNSVGNLPVEIADLVTDHLSPLKNLPLQCTRVLPRAYWTRALLSGKVVPWLWDLDIKKIEEKLATSPDNNGWDVERLVRQLSQSGFADYCLENLIGASDTVPYGLLNRSRIWRLIESW
jgi:hypothetical protein